MAIFLTTVLSCKESIRLSLSRNLLTYSYLRQATELLDALPITINSMPIE